MRQARLTGETRDKSATWQTGSPQPEDAVWFTDPEQVNHRRYEAQPACFVDGLTHAQAGERSGYTRWAIVNMLRE